MVMMINFKRAIFKTSRATGLAVVYLLVGPVLVGCHAMLVHPVHHIYSTGESIVYESSDLIAVNQNQISTEPKTDLL
jgi:hypothetical protein